jgi:hypothetical protein
VILIKEGAERAMLTPRPVRHGLAVSFAALLLLSWTGAAQQVAPAPASFAARIAALSEPGGFFNTDNLISNERSYLHVTPELRALVKTAAPGSTYLGVGPDQNFSYIGHLRPSMAIIIDIRRDNLLLHLLFKAIFAEAKTRVDYLALLTGRPEPSADGGWAQKSIDAIVAYIDGARPLTADRVAALRARLTATVDRFGVPLSGADRATMDGFHRRFIADGLSLQFNTTGRAPQYDYPTYRDLLLERDLAGTRQSFVASEDDFQFVKNLEARDLVIPVVGDLAGPTAIAAIGRFLAASNHVVSAFYTSNVEFYLFRDGTFPRFMANLGRLPHHPAGLIVRSVFPSGGAGALMRPGYNSASITQPIRTLIDGYAQGRFRQYSELTGR